jgi:L-alanine-DL-glutamate epimerase-like enolase superfamily enzyme
MENRLQEINSKHHPLLQHPAPEFPIRQLRVSAYSIPTDYPESDGSFRWHKTTLVLVEVEAESQWGLGYTYADLATAQLISHTLADVVLGLGAMHIPLAWHLMVNKIRNLGRPGIASMAIAAVDNALWDLKAKLLGQPLARLFGQCRDCVPVYGSGGFTSYDRTRLQAQLRGWAEVGFEMVKIKIGREPAADVQRVQDAREAIGEDTALFVDANGAYSRKQALQMAEKFQDYGVCWFEEPLSSDDLEGLRLLVERIPAGMEVTAGEYGYELGYFKTMLAAGAVDVLQADASRCGGLTGFLEVAALCKAFGLPLSSHCCPSLHLPAALSLPQLRHLEYFHDHVRIEQLLFEGAPVVKEGSLYPNLSSPGFGLLFKHQDAQPYLHFQKNIIKKHAL